MDIHPEIASLVGEIDFDPDALREKYIAERDKRLREEGFESIRMVESAGDFGGTWDWNRYSGALCDVESYCYLPLLEELGYMPKHKYSFAPEILEHSRRIARHYNLHENAMMQTAITALEWDETAARWIISTNRGDRFTAQYVCMANGPLNRP